MIRDVLYSGPLCLPYPGTRQVEEYPVRDQENGDNLRITEITFILLTDLAWFGKSSIC